jgi:hypothetical protein
MKYFQQFPTIQMSDYNGNSVNVTNIMQRADIIPNLLNNAQLFYTYSIKDTDTPDIIAQKYYNDSYRYWITLFSNQTIDPIGNWPMSPSLFNDFLVDKYASATANSLNISVANVTSSQVLTYTQNTIYQYIETITTTDSTSSESNTTIYFIDEAAYNNVVFGTASVLLPSGASVTESISAYPQYIYDYEIETNESKRNINLINSSYTGALEKQLSSILK